MMSLDAPKRRTPFLRGSGPTPTQVSASDVPTDLEIAELETTAVASPLATTAPIANYDWKRRLTLETGLSGNNNSSLLPHGHRDLAAATGHVWVVGLACARRPEPVGHGAIASQEGVAGAES